MAEPFKTPTVEAPETQQETPQAPKPLVSDELAGNESKASEPLTNEEHKLDIWEGLNRRKFGHDYFDIKNIAHEFPLKAHFGAIDKFIKSEMEAEGMEMNTQNYEEFIKEIEDEIGTTKTETFGRIRRIFNYIQTLKKYRAIKEKKESYKALHHDRDF